MPSRALGNIIWVWEAEQKGPQRCPNPSPATCDYVTLHSRRDFINVIKVRILRWRACPALYGWTQYNHRGPCAEDSGESREAGGMWKEGFICQWSSQRHHRIFNYKGISSCFMLPSKIAAGVKERIFVIKTNSCSKHL